MVVGKEYLTKEGESFKILAILTKRLVKVKYLLTGNEDTHYAVKVESGDIKDFGEGTVHSTRNFGDLKVLEKVTSNQVRVEFLRTGYKTCTQVIHIKTGNVKDALYPNVYGVGFMGEGRYSSINDNLAYSSWMGILERSYSQALHNKYPTYKGCSVCEEWHNFQNFADWYYNNHPDPKRETNIIYHLDKDIRSPNKTGKLYAPELCKFVRSEENQSYARAESYIFLSPKGDVVRVYNLTKFCEENNLSKGNMCSVHKGMRNIHKGWKKFEQDCCKEEVR